VLVVEDEPVAADAHRAYVERVPGYEVVGVARTGAEAMRALGDRDIDLVLLDLHLPDRHGLDLVRAMRAAGHPADVIAVTSARDLAVVRTAVSQGVVQYILKPFAFAALRDRLERYATYREHMDAQTAAGSQGEVDQMLSSLRGPGQAELPKGLSQPTLDAVVAVLRRRPDSSAAEIAQQVGASRVTARRYLEYLADTGVAARSTRYGGTGRPEVEYRLT
jgi:response regulator of citrate/malate metabolism